MRRERDDLRRLLAYGIVNQVGVMVVGIGIGTAMAKNGVAAHAFTHILYKTLLVMAAGAVLRPRAGERSPRRRARPLNAVDRAPALTSAC